MMRHVFQRNFEHHSGLFDTRLFKAVVPSIKSLSSQCDFFLFFLNASLM